jgi:protein TonB
MSSHLASTSKTPAVSSSPSSFTTPPSFGQSAGAAAAPAKSKEDNEIPRPATKIVKTADEADEAVHQKVREIEAAAEAAREEAEHSAHAPDFAASTHETKASRMPLIAAMIVVALGAAGYLGWNKMHISDKFSPDQGPPPALHVQPPPSAASADLVQGDEQASPAATAQTSPTTPAQPQPASNGPQSRSQAGQQSLGVSQQPVSSPNGKPSAGKTTTIEAFNAVPKTDEAKTDQAKTDEARTGDAKTDQAPVPEKKTPEPLAVTSAPPLAEQPVAPALQAAVGASDQTISGLVGSTSLRIPKHDPEVLKISEGIIEGMLIKKVRPIYPAQAMQLRKQGTVQILANISKNGSITNPKLINGDPMLARAAIDAVKQWKYKPYLLDGQPVEVQTQISINFKLP